MADCDVINGISDCTLSVTTPITVTPSLSGYTRISEFTFTPNLTGGFLESYHKEVSNIKTYWDFGDGYTLSAANTYTATHTYNYPGDYKVTLYFYDNEGNALLNLFSETISIKNYITTKVELVNKNSIAIRTGSLQDSINNNSQFKSYIGYRLQTSWQDYNPGGNTVYFAASGAKTDIFESDNRYGHLIPYRGFYVKNKTGTGFDIVENKHTVILTPLYYKLDSNNEPQKVPAGTTGAVILGASSDNNSENTRIYYYDEFHYRTSINSKNPKVIFGFDTSQHTLKDLFINNQTGININLSKMNFMESNIDVATLNMVQSVPDKLVFTTTGLPDMKMPIVRRQNNKFRAFIAAQNISQTNSFTVTNPCKYFGIFNYDPTGYDNNEIGKFKAEVRVGSITAEPDPTLTSYISSLSCRDLPYNNSLSSSELSSFLYINYTPTLSSNIQQTQVITISGKPATNMPILTGAYTFTVIPSAENLLYKVKEYEFNYSEVLKNYRFQEFLYEYDNLFNSVLEPIVGTNTSEPGTLGKRFIEKIGNFVINNVDIDTCNIDVLKKLYKFLNEKVTLSSTIIPPDLKRMYDLFSIKTKLLFGEQEKNDKNFSTQSNSVSGNNVNVNYSYPLSVETYMVSAGKKFVAVQKFGNIPILIDPMKVPTSTISVGSTSTYPLSDFNTISDWGWPLDTTVSGIDLKLLYDFYEFYDFIYSNTIRNNILHPGSYFGVDYDIKNNIDYQLRKGLSL